MQGVFFRAATGQQARSLGLTGHAKNLADGCVEVIACGEQQDLAKLRSWLAQGPPMARVDDVQCASLEMEVPDQFIIV